MDISLACIHIPPNRQRKAFAENALQLLAASMASKGLLHPIVVRPWDDPVTGREYELVCGERRFRAAKLLGWERIPATAIADLDPIARREAELEENILRVDLTWQERTAAIAELHRLRGGTARATAAELTEANGAAQKTNEVAVSRALVLDKFKADPHVQAARNEQEAYKIATSKLQAEFAADLSAQVAEVPSEHTLIIGDCLDHLLQIPPATFDLIITDPPYAMGADSFGDAGAAHSYSDGDEAIRIADGIIHEGLRITKSQAHLYMFCDIDWFAHLRERAREAGWYPWRTPLIWHKGDGQGHNPVPEIGFRRTYETILYAVKGGKPANFLMADVISDKWNKGGTPEHAAAKPSWLYEALIKRSCRAGDSILDPCAGSGTVFTAAKACNVRATGIEIDPGFATLCRGKM